LTPFIGDPHN